MCGVGKKKGKGKAAMIDIDAPTFESLGGFGAVAPNTMRLLPRTLKAAVLHMFRRSRKVRSPLPASSYDGP